MSFVGSILSNVAKYQIGLENSKNYKIFIHAWSVIFVITFYLMKLLLIVVSATNNPLNMLNIHKIWDSELTRLYPFLLKLTRSMRDFVSNLNQYCRILHYDYKKTPKTLRLLFKSNFQNIMNMINLAIEDLVQRSTVCTDTWWIRLN